MAENEEGTENVSRGNEWEVVSLTASAYAAAPGPDHTDLINDETSSSEKEGGETSSSEKEGGTETSDAMFMSRHFVFPPSQHENLPMDSKNVEIGCELQGEDVGPKVVKESGGKSDTKNEGNLNINVSDVYPAIPIFYDKGNILSVSGTEIEGSGPLQGLNLVDKEQSFYDAAKFSSFEDESAMVEESSVISESTEFFDQSKDSGMSNMPGPTEKDKYDEPNLPCEAWWKKQAASIYAHAKDANAFWSVFIAAAVMGIVILGHRWQQERLQALQLKWHFGANDETTSRMLRPLSRLKDVFVGGSRRGSFIRGSSSMEH